MSAATAPVDKSQCPLKINGNDDDYDYDDDDDGDDDDDDDDGDDYNHKHQCNAAFLIFKRGYRSFRTSNYLLKMIRFVIGPFIQKMGMGVPNWRLTYP